MSVRITAIIAFVVFFLISIFYVMHKSRGPAGSLDDRMMQALQEYIRMDTTHPSPDYRAAIALFEKLATADGFQFNRITLPSGNPVEIITFQGSNPQLPSLVLNHHMDVVPADNPDEWIAKPFDAKIVDNQLIGRGVQDMKGIGMLHYFALKELKDKGFVPQRTIHIFAVPDEEVGGFKGTKEFLETDLFKKLNVGYVVDEGHASGSAKTLDIKVSERKPIQIRITVTGALAHASHLQEFNAVHELVNFLSFITGLHTQNQMEAEKIAPGKLLSLNISSLKAGVGKDDGSVALNMIPAFAQATVDIRVPPTMKKKDVLALFEKERSKYPHLTYTIVAQADEEPELSDQQSLLYSALKRAVEDFGYSVQPHYFEASSDLRFYLARGIDSIGFTPFTVKDNIHGTNESVPLDQLKKGREILAHFIEQFTA